MLHALRILLAMTAPLIGTLPTFAQTAPEADETRLGPITVTRNILGQNVDVKIEGDVKLATKPSGIEIRVELYADMSDLQKKFDAIVKTIPLPRNNCPSYGVHIVASWERADIKSNGTEAEMNTLANATVWGCAKNPIPACRRESRDECHRVLGRRVCWTNPAVIVCEDGSPVKTTLVSEGFRTRLRANLVSADGKSIEVRPTAVSIEPRGDLGRFANQLAGLVDKDLSTLADKELDKLVDAGVLRQVIPPYAASFDLKIERANFTSRSGVLGMEAVFVATVPAQHLNEVIQKLAQAR